jgi:hypothetical protein
MKKLIYLLGTTVALGSCQKSDSEPSEDTAALHDRFHGQYDIVSATADRAVDLNRDGRASTDLTTEIPYLNQAKSLNAGRLLIRIRDNSEKIFEEWWPQPYLARNWQYSSPDSMMLNGYLSQVAHRNFTFDKAVTGLLVEPGPAAQADGGRFAAPEKVTIEGDGQLRVVTQRLLYIGRSWQLVRITVVYKRLTIIT